MELILNRIAKKDTYTIGRLYVNGTYLCDTLEDKDRGLTKDMSVSEIQKKKVYGETAIPIGKYQVIMSYSNKFKKVLPLILNVPGYSGIRFHSGNTANDSLGCILVGQNKVVGKVINSRDTMNKLQKILTEACKKEKIYITIK